MAKRLARSTTDRKIWGVCGGLAEYFGIDPAIVRVIFVLLAFANGLGILAYIIFAIVTPSGPATRREQASGEQTTPSSDLPPEPRTQQPTSSGAVVVGVVLVAIGFVFLMANIGFFRWFRWGIVLPIILIIVGVLLFLGRVRR